jgi:hypothetical protein
MKNKLFLSTFFISCVLCLQAQSSGTNDGWPGELKGGIRIQKAQKLYWENGFSFDFTSPMIADRRIHLGASYLTTRFGSAMGSNAIKQDNYLFSVGYHFRHQKQFQPFSRLNTGYFHADYEEPIMTEYNALRAKGYTNINFAGSSTACPLVMDLIKKGKIGDNGMKHIFMVDPIVIPSDKLLTIIGLVGPMMGYLETTMTTAEEGHWYHFRPQETLKQLLNLTEKSRKDLQKGYNLPAGIRMKVYKSIKDPSADPVSAVLIYKGLKNSDGSNVDIEMIDSELHVFTRLDGRDSITQHDKDNQTHVFDDMYKILMQ